MVSDQGREGGIPCNRRRRLEMRFSSSAMHTIISFYADPIFHLFNCIQSFRRCAHTIFSCASPRNDFAHMYMMHITVFLHIFPCFQVDGMNPINGSDTDLMDIILTSDQPCDDGDDNLAEIILTNHQSMSGSNR